MSNPYFRRSSERRRSHSTSLISNSVRMTTAAYALAAAITASGVRIDAIEQGPSQIN
jgi:hypothetical protein